MAAATLDPMAELSALMDNLNSSLNTSSRPLSQVSVGSSRSGRSQNSSKQMNMNSSDNCSNVAARDREPSPEPSQGGQSVPGTGPRLISNKPVISKDPQPVSHATGTTKQQAGVSAQPEPRIRDSNTSGSANKGLRAERVKEKLLSSSTLSHVENEGVKNNGIMLRWG